MEAKLNRFCSFFVSFFVERGELSVSVLCDYEHTQEEKMWTQRKKGCIHLTFYAFIWQVFYQ